MRYSDDVFHGDRQYDYGMHTDGRFSLAMQWANRGRYHGTGRPACDAGCHSSPTCEQLMRPPSGALSPCAAFVARRNIGVAANPGPQGSGRLELGFEGEPSDDPLSQDWFDAAINDQTDYDERCHGHGDIPYQEPPSTDSACDADGD